MKSRPSKPTKPAAGGVAGFHPRNRHQGRYDFEKLIALLPELATFVMPNPYGDLSIDFANPEAVKALNRALLGVYYGLAYWDIPPGFLCPPIPGRADYIHHLADLLAESRQGEIPRGPGVRVLDIGVGANAVYPIVGHGEYAWSFVGADIDAVALESARRIVESNPQLGGVVTLRRQRSRENIFAGVVTDNDRFDLTVCNPPFHASAEEAGEGSLRKWRNLGKGGSPAQTPALNFGGRAAELWCPGGEVAFVRRMITESARIPMQCRWFTTLVAKSAHLPAIHDALRRAGAAEFRTIDMAQGAKKTRFTAWSFHSSDQRRTWSKT